MRRLLGVENVIFNLKPVTLKLELSDETLNQVVACWQSEAKQLEMILLRWPEKQENIDDYAMLRRALEGLEPAGKPCQELFVKILFARALLKLKLGLTVN